MSDGRPHLPATWAWLEHELIDLGGLSRDPDREGCYHDRDTGEVVWDRSRHYVVALPRTQVDELRRLLRQACRKFRQKCIYLSVTGKVEFVEGASDAPE